MANQLFERAFALLSPQVDFLAPRLAPGDVVLLVETARERRFAIVTPEEAASHLTNLRSPETALAELRRDPADFNYGAPGFVWLAIALGDEHAYVTVRVQKKTLPPFEERRDVAVAALAEQIERQGLPTLALEGGFIVMTLQGSTRKFEVLPRDEALKLAGAWELPVDKLEESPGVEPGMQRVWVLAWIEGGPIYFWTNFLKKGPTVN